MIVQTSSNAIHHLAPEYLQLREALRETVAHGITPHAADVDANSRFPTEAYQILVASGFHAPHIPTEYGGVGADEIATNLVVEEVARGCASSSLIPAVNALGSLPVLLAGSAELKQEVLTPLASGKVMFSYALSERESGSDASAMRARADRDGDSWVLRGTKAWVTNAGMSTYYTVMAKTDPDAGAHGVSAFVVHRDDPGFSVGEPEHKMGIKGSPTCEIYLQDCRIPAHRIIGEPGTGFSTALRSLDHTRLTIGAQAVGIAQGALDAAIAYIGQRRQFGKMIAEFEGVQFMIAEMAMRVEAARTLVYAGATKAIQGAPDLRFASAAAKCFASDVAMSVTTDAVQLFGGAGYTQDFPVERMMRDAKITQIYEGTNQIQRLVMARYLLK
ncbi:MAG: acyl-CoA dehydrogenase [Acidimicrobiales bacterium]|nr:MAG: acyl-CoA dehydrogenase [Acidimicrobiales bacterium]